MSHTLFKCIMLRKIFCVEWAIPFSYLSNIIKCFQFRTTYRYNFLKANLIINPEICLLHINSQASGIHFQSLVIFRLKCIWRDWGCPHCLRNHTFSVGEWCVCIIVHSEVVVSLFNCHLPLLSFVPKIWGNHQPRSSLAGCLSGKKLVFTTWLVMNSWETC